MSLSMLLISWVYDGNENF